MLLFLFCALAFGWSAAGVGFEFLNVNAAQQRLACNCEGGKATLSNQIVNSLPAYPSHSSGF